MRALLMIGLVLFSGCTARTTDDGIDVDAITDRVGDWDATLSPRSGSSVRGSATVRSMAAGSNVSITINGATPDSHHPWHVHRGTCGSGGSIVGNASAYPALHVASDGTASATANVTVGLSEDERYHVNVHQSPAALNTIVACGNLDD